MAEDYYSTLGISRSASQDEILKAYRRLARKYHPDLNPDDEKAKRQFQAVQVAYDTLQDPEKRKLYDQFGEGYEAYRNNPFGAGKPGPAGSISEKPLRNPKASSSSIFSRMPLRILKPLARPKVLALDREGPGPPRAHPPLNPTPINLGMSLRKYLFH